VADPGFDLGGGVDFVNGGGEGGGFKIIESVDGGSKKSEASVEKNVLGIKNHRSAAVRPLLIR